MQRPTMFKGYRPQVPVMRERTGTFFVSNHNLSGNTMKFLHLSPHFMRRPDMYYYEISGSDGFKMDGNNNFIKVENNPMIILSFPCKAGETYFCKIIASYAKTKMQNSQQEYDTEEFRLFYKVNDDFDTEEESNDEKDNIDEETELEDVSDREGEEEEEIGDVSDNTIKDIKDYMFSTRINTGLDFQEDKEE